jgi:hypothetical protein
MYPQVLPHIQVETILSIVSIMKIVTNQIRTPSSHQISTTITTTATVAATATTTTKMYKIFFVW